MDLITLTVEESNVNVLPVSSLTGSHSIGRNNYIFRYPFAYIYPSHSNWKSDVL